MVKLASELEIKKKYALDEQGNPLIAAQPGSLFEKTTDFLYGDNEGVRYDKVRFRKFLDLLEIKDETDYYKQPIHCDGGFWFRGSKQTAITLEVYYSYEGTEDKQEWLSKAVNGIETIKDLVLEQYFQINGYRSRKEKHIIGKIFSIMEPSLSGGGSYNLVISGDEYLVTITSHGKTDVEFSCSNLKEAIQWIVDNLYIAYLDRDNGEEEFLYED
jgi:hypothetical protein